MSVGTDIIKEKYDRFASKYDLLESLTLGFFGLRRLRRDLSRRASGRTLEVAVGTGLNLGYLGGNGPITATDLSRGMLEMAKRKAAALGLDVRFAQMDTENLGFPDDSFDTVIDSLALCTYIDPVAALKEMSRVCRHDGRILLLEHGSSSSRWARWLQDFLAEPHARALGCYWNREPLRLADDANLRVVSSKRYLLGVFHIIELAPIKLLDIRR